MKTIYAKCGKSYIIRASGTKDTHEYLTERQNEGWPGSRGLRTLQRDKNACRERLRTLERNRLLAAQ